MKVRAILLIYILFFQCAAMAEDALVKMHVFKNFYSGKEQKTFDTEASSMGLELILTTQNSHWNYFSKGRFTQTTGSQEFLDGGAKTESDYKYYQGTFELGFLVYPIEKKTRGLNLYFGSSALISYNYLTLDHDFNNLQPAYHAMSFGYSGVLGFEWYAFNSKSWVISGEFTFRNESANLAGQSQFGLGGISMGAGFAW